MHQPTGNPDLLVPCPAACTHRDAPTKRLWSCIDNPGIQAELSYLSIQDVPFALLTNRLDNVRFSHRNVLANMLQKLDLS